MTTETLPRRLALHCAEPHPLDPTALCRLLSGHGGIHQAGDDTTWDSDWTTTDGTGPR